MLDTAVTQRKLIVQCASYSSLIFQCTYLPPAHRLSEQAQRQLLDSEKFEDILLGSSRPTIVIQRYEELYSQARLEALDAVEGLQIKHSAGTFTAVMDASDMFNVQLMLDVFKVCPFVWVRINTKDTWEGLWEYGLMIL